jgi:acetyl esterase/lipase
MDKCGNWRFVKKVGLIFSLTLSMISASSLLAQGRRGQRGAGGSDPLPGGTAALHDLAYVTNGHMRQKLDLYLPKGNKKVPLIIFIHGGAFTRGDKKDQSPAPFLSDGYAFASLNYRLSQDAIFPAQIEDCKAAVRWLRLNAEKYRLDPDRFGAWGTSAGGHLVALLGTTGDTKIFDLGENLEFSSRIQAVADWFGPTDFLQMDAHKLPNKEKVVAANPITYIGPNAPPFLIAHGDADRLVPYQQSVLLEAALKAVEVPVTFYTVKGGGHGFRNDAADKLRTEFFAKYLKR